MINGASIDLARFASEQAVIGVKPGCFKFIPQCSGNAPCVFGTCHNRFNTYFCDCRDTMYTGSECHISKYQYLRFLNYNPWLVLMVEVHYTILGFALHIL